MTIYINNNLYFDCSSGVKGETLGASFSILIV